MISPNRFCGSRFQLEASLVFHNPDIDFSLLRGEDAVHGYIFDLRRYAVQDGPGIRTTLFLKGCPLACLWCHNPESQGFAPEVMPQERLCIGCGLCFQACPQHFSAPLPPLGEERECLHCGRCAEVCPTGARLLVGRQVTAAEILPQLLRDRPFYDQSGGGVTLSGGEPLAQPEFTLELLQMLGREEIHRSLDTSGYAPAELVRTLAPYCDLWLYDIKLMDPELHRRYTGVDNALIFSNLRLLAELGAEVIIRVPLIPGVNDTAAEGEALKAMALSLSRRYPIQYLPYHALPEGKYAALGRTYPLAGLQPPSEAELQRMQRLVTY